MEPLREALSKHQSHHISANG